MKYIGIASGLFHTGNLCIIIDIAQSIKSINNSCSKLRYKNLYEMNNYNDTIKKKYNLSTNYTDKIMGNKREIFKNDVGVTNDIFSDYTDFKFKYPIDVLIKRKYVRDEDGNIHLMYDRESYYDDGSKLIQYNI